MNETLLEALQRYTASDAVPMHMPGHKRNGDVAPFLKTLNAPLDITEIDGFDDLHDARGILRRGMERAARLWGARRTFFLVNGSTCGILASIHAVLGRGGHAVVARNCHKSVYHGLELCNVTPHFVYPQMEERFGICASISPAQIEQALAACPQAQLVIVTSPTYEGILSDIAAIAEIAHRHGALLLVDEAHGAHLGMGDFPDGAVACGADLVVQSAHKTLPSLTQTAFLHLSGERVDSERVARSLEIFETSSPSYLLMASLDSCVELLEREGEDLMWRWQTALTSFYHRVQHLRRLRVLGCGAPLSPAVYDRDVSKIVVSTAGTSMKGPELMETLRKQAGIELEMASADYVVAMTGPGDTPATLNALADALCTVDENIQQSDRVSLRPALQPMHRECTIQQAMASPREKCAQMDALGRVSAGYVWAYPPGIPLLVPGERIEKSFLSLLNTLQASGVSLRGISDGLWVKC